MSGVSEAIWRSTEDAMLGLGFGLSTTVEETMYSLVAYDSARGRAVFATDVREQELTISVRVSSSPDDFDIRVIARSKLGLRRKDLQPLWQPVRADQPGEVSIWLNEKLPIIIKILSESRLWE